MGDTFLAQVVHNYGVHALLCGVIVKQMVGKGVSKCKKRTAQKLPSVYIKARQKVAKVWNIYI
jgi:hypothetical protein